jgi:hypothetical protein
MINRKTIEEFIKQGQVLIPKGWSWRADLANCHSRYCPYSVGPSSRLDLVFDANVAKKMVEEKGYDYCWNACDITDCPAYVENVKTNFE